MQEPSSEMESVRSNLLPTVVEPFAKVCQTLLKKFGREHLERASQYCFLIWYEVLPALCSTLNFIRAPGSPPTVRWLIPNPSTHPLYSSCVTIVTRWPSFFSPSPSAIYGCTSPRLPIVKHKKCNGGRASKIPLGRLITLGIILRNPSGSPAVVALSIVRERCQDGSGMISWRIWRVWYFVASRS